MPITNYEQYMNPELSKGSVATISEHRADTAPASAAIAYGLAVQYTGTGNEQVKRYDGTGSFVGVAISRNFRDHRYNTLSEQNPPAGTYKQYEAVSVFRKGTIWVEVKEDVTKGDAAVVDNTTGDFRPGDTATTTVSDPVGVFKSSALANGLAQLEINLP